MASIDLRVGDRITVLPGKARSAHTRAVLTRGFTVEVTSMRPDLDGDIEATGILLTARGAWRTSLPVRSVILNPDSYTTPIRVGDTVLYRHTGETPVVTAIHERPDGTALADLLFASGSTGCGYRLVDLEHVARPAAEPPAQLCLRRHDPALPCARCAEATRSPPAAPRCCAPSPRPTSCSGHRRRADSRPKPCARPTPCSTWRCCATSRRG